MLGGRPSGLAARLDAALCVSYHSGDLAEAQAAKQDLAGVDSELQGLLATDEP